jgi:hypothetical protein
MLTNQRLSDDFSLLLGAGAFLRDDQDLASDVDAFQSAEDRRQVAKDAGDTALETQILLEQSKIVRNIDGKVFAPEVTGVLSMGAAFDKFAMAISARADAIAAGTVRDLACEVGTPGCDLATFESQLDSDQFNIVELEGVLATELAVAFATDFSVFDRKFSIGIKPKVVDLKAITYSESIKTFDAGLGSINDEDQDFDLGTFTSVDIGLAYDLSDSLRLGLNIRNLLTDEFELLNNTLKFDTTARLGVAYHNSFVTVAVDYDLVEVEPLLANPTFDGLKTQYLALGAEFNAFDYAQLRLGAHKNIASNTLPGADDIAYTAGVGFWLGFNLDLAATISDNSIGGFLQTGFRF